MESVKQYIPQKITIAWLKRSYEEGTITPTELAEEIVHRAEAEKEKNIWITPPSMELMLPYLKRLEEKKPEEAPLWGIPFAIKDNIDLAGVPTTAACPAYAYTPQESATVVEKLLEAGAFPVGKTNMDQFATGLVGTRSPYGEVHNALEPELISGGSSSGSAVAVALGMASISLGTDTAGSGRVPALLNGLVGYKPSVGAWSSKGVVPACASLDCVTVFANNLEDAELVNTCVRGVDENCIWSRELPETVREKPEKILLPKDALTFYGDYAAEYQEKWNQAVERLKTLGIPIEYIDYSMFSEAALILYEGPWVCERWKDLGDFVKAHPGEIFPVTEQILSGGDNPKHTAVSLFQAMHKLQEYKQKAKKLLGNGVLIMPTAGGTFTREQVRKDPIKTNSQMGLYTNHCNLLDLCAAAVPTQTGSIEGHPFGITIFAAAEKEGRLLSMAEQFMEAETIPLAVCGQHMRGFALNWQLTQLGARYLGEAVTRPCYRLLALPTEPVKPGLLRAADGKGTGIQLELYEMPKSRLGIFLAGIPAPLGLGNVELEDGTFVKGFLCDADAQGQDISGYKSFREYMNQSNCSEGCIPRGVLH